MNKTYQVGLPFMPGKLKTMETKKGYKIHLTFGGGMGGGMREIFTYKKVDTTQSFVKIKDIFGVERDINLLHVVAIDPVQILIWGAENRGNTYVKCPIGKTQTNYYYFDPTDKIKMFLDDICRDDNTNNYLKDHLISTIIE